MSRKGRHESHPKAPSNVLQDKVLLSDGLAASM